MLLHFGGVDCRLLEYRVLPPKPDAPSLREMAKEAREESTADDFAAADGE